MSSPPPPAKRRRTARPISHADGATPTARAAALIASSHNILVITGAGISTSCGIPDFRSQDGLYALLAAASDEQTASSIPVVVPRRLTSPLVVEEPASEEEVPRRRSSRLTESGNTVIRSPPESETYHVVDPQEIMDISVFRTHPEVFYRHAFRLFPGKEIRPSVTHRWLKRLETEGKLLRLYTQNIDGLESQAGVSRRLFHAHGTLTTSTCTSCRHRVDTSVLLPAIKDRQVPLCGRCLARTAAGDAAEAKRRKRSAVGVYKPDITFFHEPVPRQFHSFVEKDLPKVDLCLVIGTSLLIPPVKDIPGRIPDHVPKILINRDIVKGVEWTVFCQGDCDEIVVELDQHLLRRHGAK